MNIRLGLAKERPELEPLPKLFSPYTVGSEAAYIYRIMKITSLTPSPSDTSFYVTAVYFFLTAVSWGGKQVSN